MKSKLTMIVSATLAVFLLSCDKLNVNSSVEDVLTIAEDEILSLKSGEMGGEETDLCLFGSKTPGFGNGLLMPRPGLGCATVTSSGDEYPKEIVIDFGEGCVGRHGEIRTGKIIITMSADILEEGAEYKVVYEDVTMGGRLVEHTSLMTNQGPDSEGHWVITSSVDHVTTYEDGSLSSRKLTGASEWLSGFGTMEPDDDIFLRTGSGTVITSEGEEFTREITTPLLFDRSCLYIKSGVVELNKNGSEVIIDFGGGECDQWATVTIDGETEEVDLSKRKGPIGFHGVRRGR